MLPLSEQLKQLECLQKLDLKIDALKKDQVALPGRLKDVEGSIDQLTQSLMLKNTQLAEFDKTLRQTQAAIELNQERLTRAHSKFEQAKNSQEFQAATKEVEQLKKLEFSLREQEQKAQTDQSSLQIETEQLNEKLKALTEKKAAQAVDVLDRETALDQQIAVLMSDRAQFVSQVEAKMITQYQRIRAARGGLGIVSALGGRCCGCNMIVPPQLYNEIQRNQVVHGCPSCHRLLFIPVASSAPVDSSASLTPSIEC